MDILFENGTIRTLERNSPDAQALLVRNGRIAAVGSFNLDDRSFYIDTETALVVDSPAFCRALQGEFERLFAQCAQVGPDGGYLPGSVEPVPVPPKKRATMALVSLFSRAVRPLI